MVAFTFNAADFNPSTGATSQLPVGIHPVVITDSVIVSAKSNQQNGVLNLTLKAIDGPAKGVEHTYRLNVYHTEDQPRRIAMEQLFAICHVIGLPNFVDTAALHNRPFCVKVQPQKGENADKYTEIASVMDMNGNVATRGNFAAGAGNAGPPAGGQQTPPQSQGFQAPQNTQNGPTGSPQGGFQPPAGQGQGFVPPGAQGGPGGQNFQPPGGQPQGFQPPAQNNTGGAAPAGGAPWMR